MLILSVIDHTNPKNALIWLFGASETIEFKTEKASESLFHQIIPPKIHSKDAGRVQMTPWPIYHVAVVHHRQEQPQEKLILGLQSLKTSMKLSLKMHWDPCLTPKTHSQGTEMGSNNSHASLPC